MKQKILLFALPVCLCLQFTQATAQSANQTLSNLTSPTSVNQNLLSEGNNTRNLGSASKSWKILFIDSSIYLKDSLFLNNNGTNNAFVGQRAGYSVTIGDNNAGFGYHSLYNNKTGAYNTSVGSLALYKNNKGSDNAAVGYQALYHNTTGTNNTATGYQALYHNTTGYTNVANGVNALYNNTEGVYNTASGTSALYSNTTGAYNTANGGSALYSNTTGTNNTANGYQALYHNTTGYTNVANGVNALYNNTEGVYNTANGTSALYSNTTGFDNTANGGNTLYSNTTGFDNTANGKWALYSNTIGTGNTANGDDALYDNTEGINNTAIGQGALSNNTTGDANTAIGAGANVFSISKLGNATAVGFSTMVDASNKVRVGNENVTSIGGQVGWTTFSDGRYKKNIRQDVQGLAFINSLQPITYTVDINGLNAYYDKGRKHDSAYEKIKADMKESADKASKIIYNGFIAQDVEKAATKLNYNFSGVDKPQSKDGLYGLRYADFVVPLVKAVQELSKTNNEKDAKIDDLEKRLGKVEQLLATQLNNNAATNIAVSGASLEQNIPNPFTQTTTIGYTLPAKFASAQILITDKTGKVLKQVNVKGSGKGMLNINASILASGAYNYSLMVDGKMIATKQMVLVTGK